MYTLGVKFKSADFYICRAAGELILELHPHRDTGERNFVSYRPTKRSLTPRVYCSVSKLELPMMFRTRYPVALQGNRLFIDLTEGEKIKSRKCA